MDLENPFKFMAVVFGIAIGLVTLIIVILQTGNLYLQPTVRVYINGVEVFRGNNACVVTNSLGANTEVQIRRGLLCIQPQEVYVSKNVLITPLDN